MTLSLQHLAEQYAAQPSPRFRQETALAGQALVRAIVSRTSVPTHVLAAREDLESVGMMGLLQALDGYDPSRGTPFASFAYGRIRGMLVDYLRSIDPLSREQRRRLATAQEAQERLRQRIGGEATDVEIAEAAELSVDTYRELVATAQGRFSLSLDAAVHEDGDSSLLDLLPSEEAQDAFEQIERSSLMDHLALIVRTLPVREQRILALYYYEDLTLREIAGMMDLTEARISQILSKTLRGLRGHLQPQGFAKAA